MLVGALNEGCEGSKVRALGIFSGNKYYPKLLSVQLSCNSSAIFVKSYKCADLSVYIPHLSCGSTTWLF